MLIKRVYEVDPLACPKCGGQMKVVAFIESSQGAVIEKILRHCGLWQPSTPRPPPVDETAEGDEGLDDWSDADWFSHAGQAAKNFADGDFSGSPAEDFAQVAPDDSVYVDIGPFEAVF